VARFKERVSLDRAAVQFRNTARRRPAVKVAFQGFERQEHFLLENFGVLGGRDGLGVRAS
jgi:hypothetical protein